MEDYFQLTGAHNTVEIDRRPPVERVSRFLYFPWPRATMRWFEGGGSGLRYFEGQSSDYDRRPWNILHRRAIVGLDDDVLLIVDDLLGRGRHTATLRWHLADVPVNFDKSANIARLKLDESDWCLSAWCDSDRQWDKLEIVRGRIDHDSIQGFASPYYGERIPIPVMEAEITAELPLRMLTIAAPGKISRWQARGNSVSGDNYELSVNGRAWIVELARLERRSQRTVSRVVGVQPGLKNGIHHPTSNDSASAIAASRH
jgi:hypothetical protein